MTKWQRNRKKMRIFYITSGKKGDNIQYNIIFPGDEKDIRKVIFTNINERYLRKKCFVYKLKSKYKLVVPSISNQTKHFRIITHQSHSSAHIYL